MNFRYFSIIIVSLIFFHSFSIFPQDNYPKREFRGAWIASVGNIDWPVSNTAASEEQVRSLKEQLAKLKRAGINVVILQVRTECDALYKSSIEPWSYWLTGEQGNAPEPFFDPLEIAIREAHSLGMEIHAWLNPFRAVRNTETYPVSSEHVSVTHPEWILQFGKYKMLNPGIPEVRDYIVSVVKDILLNYDVDGIHFDDYFYPYKPKISWQDNQTFIKYNSGIKNVDDWRRHNINSLVAQVYDTINAVKAYVKFGISPFGIVQNHYAGTSGFSSYDNLYCDPLTWIKDKTVDYIIPQLYWEIGKKAADYKSLLPWWVSVKGDRHLYIGHYSSKFLNDNWEDKSEIGKQIKMNRDNANIYGSAFFSSKTVTNNMSGFADSLTSSIYKYPALLPVMNWKDSIPPLPPGNVQYISSSASSSASLPGEAASAKTGASLPGKAALAKTGASASSSASTDTCENDLPFTYLSWEKPLAAADGDTAAYYVIYKFFDTEETDIKNPRNIVAVLGAETKYFIDPAETDKEFVYAVTSLDRQQNESEPNIVKVKFSP